MIHYAGDILIRIEVSRQFAIYPLFRFEVCRLVVLLPVGIVLFSDDSLIRGKPLEYSVLQKNIKEVL